jgi:hypothetical protein
MSLWPVIMSQSLLVMLASMALLRMNKVLRGKRGALSQRLNLNDLLVITPVALLGCISAAFAPVWANISFALILGVYGLLVWIDAMLFVQYRIEVNRQTLMWFFTGSKGLAKGLPHLLAVFKKYPWGALIPCLWLALLVAWFSAVESMVLMMVCLVTLAVAGVSLAFAKLSLPALGVLGLLALSINPIVFLLPEINWTLWGSISFAILALLLLLLALLRGLFQSQHEFLTTPTLLTNMLADDRFEANENIDIKTEHQAFVSPATTMQEKSTLFGQCAGANIILITFESLGAYIQPYTQQGAYSRIAERLKGKGWVSRQHFSLCPNTTVSTNQIYTGAYSNNPYNKEDSLYPGAEPKHIKCLKQAGYKTMFLDSADIGLYDYHKLLTRIGFDHVWGTNDLPDRGLKADYRLWNMVDNIAELGKNQPFFLHIINDQTHMPYEVVDKVRFNRHKGSDAKSLYLNAVEEVDYILDTFLTRLGEKLDLSDTLLVFTGDHGESFGEFGYSFHSNSVITPQVQVPFMLHHPKLAPKQLDHSCHFDLFPTFFDLLGIEYPYPCIGKSLALENRDFAYFFHSATLKGNSPANFGFMLDGEMMWMDRLFNRTSLILQNQNTQSLSVAEKNYIMTLFYHMLGQRGIMQ